MPAGGKLSPNWSTQPLYSSQNVNQSRRNRRPDGRENKARRVEALLEMKWWEVCPGSHVDFC